MFFLKMGFRLSGIRSVVNTGQNTGMFKFSSTTLKIKPQGFTCLEMGKWLNETTEIITQNR